VRLRKTSGTSLLAVLGVLALLAMVMAVMVQLLMTNLFETRRRANAQYAAELAHSGIDWARASLLARAPFERKLLKVRGGEIEIRVVVLEGAVRIVSAGRVVERGAVIASREEILRLGPVEETPRIE
jgi:type II secretory pathway component PulK